MSKNSNKTKVIVIGWDAADWKFINPLLDSGQMPALENLINKGVIGNIQTLDPPLSPILWTSVATGKYGDDHGILSFLEPTPETGKSRPISSHSRKTRAIWNILTKNNYKTNVIGWWPSYPAEPINGTMVSNHFADYIKDSTPDNWDLAEMHIHPNNRYDELKSLRIHPSELTWSHIAPFIPEITQKELDDPAYASSIQQILMMLSKCSSFHNVATEIIENDDWDFVGLYLDTIDKASHEFMKYHPPKQGHVSEDEYRIFKDVMSGFYRFHDMMLERIMNLVGDDAYIMLLSDHGFYSDHRRLESYPTDSLGPAYEHSPYGIIAISGPGIRQDERIYGSTLLDITPTLLHLFGLPVAKDMAGRVLIQAFKETQQIKYIDTYETNEPGNWGELDPNIKDDIWGAQDALEQLIALGYVEALDDDVESQKALMQFENKSHLARIKLAKGEHTAAIQLFEELLEQSPGNGRVMIQLLNCLITTKNIDKAKEMLERMRKLFGNINTPHLDLMESKLLLLDLKPLEALELLKKAVQMPSANSEIQTMYGKNLMMLRNWKLAQKSYLKAIELDSENADAYHGLGLSSLRLNANKKAVEYCMTAIGIRFWFPAAHFHLGEALLNCKEYEMAANAFEISLRQQPGYSLARKHLVQIYTEFLKNPERANYHIQILNKNMRPKINIVSGLPRSGTSMMMQMLHAGGSDVLTDNIRQSDENNPKGYYEFEAVKNLIKDNSWLVDQNGKTIKIIMQLLGSLNPTCDYRIIFMERDIDEVLASQQKMLGQDPKVYNTKLKDTFITQKEKNRLWIASQPNIEVLYVNYANVLNNPKEEIQRINTFLNNDLDENKMLAAVDKTLYRNVKNTTV